MANDRYLLSASAGEVESEYDTDNSVELRVIQNKLCMMWRI